MLKLTIPEGIDAPVPVQGGRPLEAGHSYLCAHRFVGQMLLSQWRVKIYGRTYPLRTLLTVQTWKGVQPSLNNASDWNDKDLWLCRGGGWGDLLSLTPLIREIKERWPRCRLHMSFGAGYHGLFHGLDVIEEFIPIPFDPLIMLIDFEELVEGHPDAHEIHIIDLFAKKAGIKVSDHEIHYQMLPLEEENAWIEYPENEKFRIGIQFLASALYRSYPKMQLVIKELARENDVFIFGFPGQVQFKPYPNVINLMDKNLSFRESAAVLSTCDLCIAPDSALVHLCSALGVPCIALYGPIPSSLRATGKSVYPIDGEAPCAPCFFHADRSIDFPKGMPCTEISRCVALDGIEVDRIVDLVHAIKVKRLNEWKARPEPHRK
jgi:ADP-heptose:LPS heptosyltransferase